MSAAKGQLVSTVDYYFRQIRVSSAMFLSEVSLSNVADTHYGLIYQYTGLRQSNNLKTIAKLEKKRKV
jgi:hypothetical protein